MTTPQDATIGKVAALMRELDFCLLTTRTGDGRLHARPMSNNGEVEFDGDVWFFSAADTRKVAEIQADPIVHLGYADTATFTFVSLGGEAAIVRDRERKRALWIDDLARWFPNGPDDENVVLIRVTARVVGWWTGEGDGELVLD